MKHENRCTGSFLRPVVRVVERQQGRGQHFRERRELNKIKTTLAHLSPDTAVLT